MKISWKEAKAKMQATVSDTDKRYSHERTIAIIKSLKKGNK